MAVVTCRIVHQNSDVTQFRLHQTDGRAQLGNVAHVAVHEAQRCFRALEPTDQGIACRIIDIDEANARALTHEAFHDGSSYSGTASANEYDFAFEARINGGTIGSHGGSVVLGNLSNAASHASLSSKSTITDDCTHAANERPRSNETSRSCAAVNALANVVPPMAADRNAASASLMQATSTLK